MMINPFTVASSRKDKAKNATIIATMFVMMFLPETGHLVLIEVPIAVRRQIYKLYI